MAAQLKAVDRVEVQVLVDNVTDNLSTLPAGADITHEWAYLLREGLVTEISGDNTCCACHGLALVITVQAGDDDQYTVPVSYTHLTLTTKRIV